MSTLVLALKGAFLAILISIFLLYFGIPSYEKFSSQETIFVESRVPFNLSNPPAIKIAINDIGQFRQMNDCFAATTNYNQTVACFENTTYEKTDLIQSNNDPLYNHISMGKFEILVVFTKMIYFPSQLTGP